MLYCLDLFSEILSSSLNSQVITEAIPDTVGGKVIGLVTTREEIPNLLKVSSS